MGLEWDARKNAANLSKHGLGFEEASEIFDGPFFQLHDNRREYALGPTACVRAESWQ